MGTEADREKELRGGDTLVARAGLLDSAVDDEEVLLDPDAGVYYGLNPVGTHLWEELQKPRTVDELVESTAETFDVSRPECEDDVYAFLADLLESDLVERR